MMETLTMKYKDKKQQKKELGCVFIRINPGKENFNIFKAMNEIHRQIKNQLKNSNR